MKALTNTQKLTISGVLMALYIILMLFTQGFAFGQYQVRLATALYALPAILPFTMLPLATANLLSNILLGGLGPLDAIGGFCVGLLTTGLVIVGKRLTCKDWIVIPIITLVPSFVVPLWLSFLLHIPYSLLVSTLIVGQSICGCFGFILIRALATIYVTTPNTKEVY